MKKKIWIIPIVIVVLLAIFFLFLFLRGKEKTEEQQEEKQEEHSFIARIIEINGSTVTVHPIENMIELIDEVSFDISGLNEIEASVGSLIKVSYIGQEMEYYPARIEAVYWENSRMEEKDEWIDKSTVEKSYYDTSDHFVITEIFSDCFFARPVVPLPYEIKLNGKLSDEWCVGDQVFCTYENYYYDFEKNRAECDFLTVEPSDWQADPDVCYKPVIYLYPTEKMDVNVNLTLDGKLTCTYPFYGNGWAVTAMPDGTLTDANGQQYNYLYWEGETYAKYDLSKGFCIKGEDTAKFLEDSLKKLGLNRREANEFIVYWLPLMEQNPYNIISFQTDVYTEAAQLKVSPEPNTLIRVFMAWKKSDVHINIEEQELLAPKRSGFTVIEWGGTELK